MSNYKPHPCADLFPMMSERELKDLAADIKANGVQNPGMIFQGMILDGRNRARACEMVGVTMQWCDMDDTEGVENFDPLAYVLSHNLHRRHLSESQRSMIAARVATMRRGDNQHAKEHGQNCPSSISDAAKALNVSPSSVKNAKRVIDKGAPEVVELVTAGELPVSVAAEFVGNVHDKNYQSSIAKQGAKAVRQVITVKPLKPPKDTNHFAEFCEWWERLSAQERCTVRPLIIGHIDGN